MQDYEAKRTSDDDDLMISCIIVHHWNDQDEIF